MISTQTIRPLCLLISLAFFQGCTGQPPVERDVINNTDRPLYDNAEILVGAERMHLYLPQVGDGTIGLIVNQTSMVGPSHLADTLLELGLRVDRIFAPEHGFRGTADAGETISDGRDARTGLPVISLYGSNKKPTPEQLEGLDFLLFDIQDVGARFYTYISTMHYVMEAAAESGIPVIVLDRPNPNGHYVDGPVLDTAYRSFVGMHPVPIVHGMTIGEYALMINGEDWLRNGIRCELNVIACDGYDHSKFYELPVKPSPNLPNMASIYLYPALCLFEGTAMSVGRGTDKQFQVLGGPGIPEDSAIFTFTPVPKPGARHPKHEGIACYGWDFSSIDVRELRTRRMAPGLYRNVLELYRGEESFFTSFFDKLAGGDKLRNALQDSTGAVSLEGIFTEGLEEFMLIRSKYLLYPDFTAN